MEDYSRNSGFLINLSQAVGRIVLAGRELTRFAGFAARLADFFGVLEEVASGRYQRTTAAGDAAESGQHVTRVSLVDDASLKGTLSVLSRKDPEERIEFHAVPVVTPAGEVLVRALDFCVRRGMNCLVTGPNGSGKSSLFRVLGSLWPLFGGHLVRPEPERIFYVPQRPYLSLGTLIPPQFHTRPPQ